MLGTTAPRDATDEALLKEEQRIRSKTIAFEKRRERIMNSKKRLIGIDVDALDQQVQELRQGRSDKKEDERLEKLRQIEIERVLAAAVEEEKMMRSFQLDTMKKSWRVR